jgi:glycosyltransferase involved in cell wall biosynthesis
VATKPVRIKERARALLNVPDAFAQWAQVPSHLVFEGTDRRPPRLTIAIPTFRRGALLVEAVRSAVEQDWSKPFEVIVVDNDPESAGATPLLEALPQLAAANFRYFVNTGNTGMFGNWNRSIELARSEWYTMLHDDDLLEPDFASRMMPILERNPKIEGVICRRVVFGPTMANSRNMPLKLARRIGTELRFRGRTTRRFNADRFFWSATNPVGLIARKQDLIALGGYQPDEYPTSDHYLQLRFAMKHRLYESRDYLVRIRLQENESMRPEIGFRMAIDFHHLRTKMAGRVVPRWWARMSGLILERQRQMSYKTDHPVARETMEQAAGIKLPRDRPALLVALKGLLGGY